MKLKITNSAKQAIFFQFPGYPRHHPQIILSLCKGSFCKQPLKMNSEFLWGTLRLTFQLYLNIVSRLD